MDDIEEVEDVTYKESKRERRIKNRLRMIARGKRHFRQNNNHWQYAWEPYKHFAEEAEMYGRKFHDYLQICSCDACGNPRHSGWTSPKWRITNQERRALQDANQQFAEIGLQRRRKKS